MDTLSLAPPFLKVNTNYMLRKIPYQTIYNYIQYFYIITSVELDAKDESGHNKTEQNGTGQDETEPTTQLCITILDKQNHIPTRTSGVCNVASKQCLLGCKLL